MYGLLDTMRGGKGRPKSGDDRLSPTDSEKSVKADTTRNWRAAAVPLRV